MILKIGVVNFLTIGLMVGILYVLARVVDSVIGARASSGAADA